MVYSLSRLRRQPQNEDDLKNEDHHKNEDDLKNEDNLKDEDNLKNEDHRTYLTRAYTTLVVLVCFQRNLRNYYFVWKLYVSLSYVSAGKSVNLTPPENSEHKS